MKEVLIVVDMQNDFVDGSLGTKEAVKIVDYVSRRIKDFKGEVLYTRDTHFEDYMETREGKNLPVKHCTYGTYGWGINKEIKKALPRKAKVFDKNTFGSTDLATYLVEENKKERIDKIIMVGLCTDICVISNALLVKAYLPEVELVVDSKGCAGATPESHDKALETMKMCHVAIE